MSPIIAAALPLGGVVLGAALQEGVAWLTKWRASPAAAAHPVENDVAGIALGVAQEALAFLRANPSVQPAAVAAWAIKEVQANAPAAATTIGDDLVFTGLARLTRQKLLTVAQSGDLDDAAKGIIKALAPTAATAKVAPPQLAAAELAALGAAPDIEAALLQNLPRLAAMVSQLVHPDPAAPAAAPVASPHAEPAGGAA